MNHRLYNFIRGAGAAFNIMPRPAGNLLGERFIPRSVAEAYEMDWGAIGRDLETAYRALAETMTHEQQRRVGEGTVNEYAAAEK